MLRKISIAIAALLAGVGLALATAAPVAAQGAAGGAREQVCQGINVGGGTCNDNGGGLQNVMRLIINIISVIAGFAAVIMIVVAGLRYITSGGDASKVAGAKSAIVYAIVGLVVVALAQVIVKFVLNTAVKGK
jgi:hypothetical protein